MGTFSSHNQKPTSLDVCATLSTLLQTKVRLSVIPLVCDIIDCSVFILEIFFSKLFQKKE